MKVVITAFPHAAAAAFALLVWIWLSLHPAFALTLHLNPIATGFSDPVFITHAGDKRIFIVELPGRIRIVQDATLLPTPFLDITALVSTGDERGLFSVAFHPSYGAPAAAGEGLFWVNYTNNDGDSVIARYAVSKDNPDRADPNSALVLLTVPQPFANHNGGQLQFGPVEGPERTRYLYIGMGDGGGAGDPLNNAQHDTTLLGKMLRIDPSTDAAPTPPFYTIPPDNPNAAAGIPLGAIWAKGLRNPWRFSFDARTGDLYIADLGQDRWEEVSFTAAGTPGGLNYGWRILEGRHCFVLPSECDASGLVPPAYEYAHGPSHTRCGIVGGYVYRGARFRALTGKYIYADLCSGEIFGLEQTAPRMWESTLLLASAVRPQTFGEDINGELYIGATDGNVYHVADLDGIPSVSIAVNKSVFQARDRMVVTVTTDPGATADRWHLLILLVTPATNAASSPFLVYRFDPQQEFVTWQEVLSRLPAVDRIFARPLKAVRSESFVIFDETLPPSIDVPGGFPPGSYTWGALMFSEDLQVTGNVAVAPFSVQ